MITLTAKIYISETEIIEIDRRNMLSIESSIFDRSDLKMPSFGIISNVGNIEFNDIDMKVLSYAEQLKLQKGLKCEIWLNNTLFDGATQVVATMETNEWDYDNDNKIVSVSLKDDLEELQEIKVEGIYLNLEKPTQTGEEIYLNLMNLTNEKGFNMANFYLLNEKTKEILTNSILSYPTIKNGSLWQLWTTFCEAFLCSIYKNSNGVIMCKYIGG